jgi:thioredoxin 1
MYVELDKDTYSAAIAATEQGIVLCSKKLCPHCANMAKVMEKFSAKQPGVALFKVDSEEQPEVMAALGAERVPTLLIIKGGKVAASKAGLMNPKELSALYDGAK